MDTTVVFGGAFGLALLNQYTLAMCYLFGLFVSGTNTNETAIIWFLLLLVAALFNKFRKAAG